ncbi:hypothetical protein [Flavobacterium sp.]
MFEYVKFNAEEREFVDDVIKNYIKANPILRQRKYFRRFNRKPKVKDFWDLSWEDILMIRQAFKTEQLFDVLEILYGLTEKEFMKLEMLNVFACYKWVTDELLKLNAAEEERLHSELSSEEINAGAEELQEYGYYNSLKAMCPDLLKQNDYLKLPYSIIFRDMAHSKLISDINKKYQENAARKNRVNRS